MNTEFNTKDWPLSNYPIFFALVFLLATAVTLSMGDETLAEELAIYAYYLLVIGVLARFFELALPVSITELVRQNLDKLAVKWRLLASRLPADARGDMTRAAGWLKHKLRTHPLKPINQKQTDNETNVPWLDWHSKLAHIEDISKNVIVLLLVFLILSSIFALMNGWWIVRTYLTNLLLVIFGVSTIYFFARTLKK